MTKFKIGGLSAKLALVAMLAAPKLASAQFFNYNPYGDVIAGFRQTDQYAGNYELVADLGNVTNFVGLAVGQTITVNLNPSLIANPTNAFTSEANIQWSVFAAFPESSSWPTPLGTYPLDTLWYTLPGTSTNTQTTPPSRLSYSAQQSPKNLIFGVENGAYSVSVNLGATNVDNNSVAVREPVSYASQGDTLSDSIGDEYENDLGDFGANGHPLPSGIENDTGTSFTSPQRCDFYQACPTGYVDPITGQTTGSAYLVGYFLLYTNGTMTFTRQLYTTPAPVAGFSASPTTGSAPLPVTFTDGSTGSITNWIWNFGDGHGNTNSTGASVTNTYAAAGSYTVTETVVGPGGPNSSVLTNYIVVTSLSAPVASFTGSPTNGFAPLKVIFTDASTGNITNRVWSFGDGHTTTNNSSTTVTNTYAASGAYAVTEVVTGAGGSSTNKHTNYIVAYAAPQFSALTASGTTLVLSGTNGPAGVQYRILYSTNLTSGWTPVATNIFSSTGNYGYTNSTTKASAFFRLVSP